MRVLFTRVPSSRVRLGLGAGLVAAAATAGAVVGFGLRHGTALDPFIFAGQTVVHGAATPLAALVGALLHLAWMLLWGVCFSAVAAPLRGARLLLAALVFATLVGTLSVVLFPAAAPLVGAPALSRAQIVVVNLLLALGLAAGMRLALPAARAR